MTMFKKFRSATVVSLMVLLVVATAGCALAAYPEKPINIIVTWGPGGGVDVTTRVFAKHVEKYLGQPMIVQNVEGGGGSVGFTQVMKSRPDGYTLTMGASPLMVHPYTIDGVAYKYSSFEPVGMLTFDPVLLLVKTGSNFDMEAKAFLEFVKNNPGKVLLGVGSHWGSHDFARAQIEMATGLEFQRVAFSAGGKEGVTALLGGHINATIAYFAEARSNIQEGTLKVIAVGGMKRSPFLPEVPTLKELGIDLELGTWRGILAPKGTPEEVLKVLRDGFTKITNDPEFLEDLEKSGNVAVIAGAEEFGAMMEKEDVAVQKVVEKLKAEQ